MSCFHPYTARDKASGLLSRVKCGKCEYCRNRRRFQWVGRLRLEAACHEHVRFLTLTYRDDPGVLQVAHLQGFLKRFRYHHGETRYFAVGEYGEKSGRGHFHLITFGNNLPLGGQVLDPGCWPYGFHLVGTATVASMSYVAGYALKDQPASAEKRPFTRMSLRPGLGFSELRRFAEAAARSPVPPGSWPQKYWLGADSYPFSDGALRYYQKCYLEFGGLPPASLSPEDRDTVARLYLHDQGTQIQEKQFVRLEHMKRGRDEFAVSQAKPKKL